MPFELETLRSLEDKRVHIKFDDGCEMIARFLSASQDMDGSMHLIFDQITWSNDARELATAKDSTCYAEGESLMSIKEMTS